MEDPWSKNLTIENNQDIFWIPRDGINIKIQHAYIHPITALLLEPMFECLNEIKIWLISAKKNSKVTIHGRVEVSDVKIIKSTKFSLTKEERFKIVGGMVHRIHSEKDFLEWFLDSLRLKSETQKGAELAILARRIALKNEKENFSKSYEYSAVAEIIDSLRIDTDWLMRRRLAKSVLYAVYASHCRGIYLDPAEVAAKTLGYLTSDPF